MISSISVAEEDSIINKISKTNEQWKQELPEDVYNITRESGTEAAYSGKYNDFYDLGIYRCSNCELDLFSSATKFNSHSGWPSFYQALSKDVVELTIDKKFFTTRTEVSCNRCGAHLGHVFDDGPAPTHKRYCINSLAFKFHRNKE